MLVTFNTLLSLDRLTVVFIVLHFSGENYKCDFKKDFNIDSISRQCDKIIQYKIYFFIQKYLLIVKQHWLLL